MEAQNYVPRRKSQYQGEVVAALQQRFEYQNPMQVPRLTKIVVNKGVGLAAQNKKTLDDAVQEVRKITGQQPTVRQARKSISNFKLREGMPVGVAVTLRGARMWEFLDRLITFALPRVRDFRGVKDKSFDGRGNYTLGVKEQIIFPEIDIDKIDTISGLDISFVTTAETDEEAYWLLRELGMPFVRRAEEAAEEEEAAA
jgi:large subunit ribosomal protein L5